MRRLDPWRQKLAEEALMLTALGYLGEDGEVRCPDCGVVVPRSEGWLASFVCSCGWSFRDLPE
jgi:hypothetical protein